MSFARNFALGQQIAQTALDTYNKARQNREIGEVINAKPETGMGYTADDGAQLEAAAKSGQYDIGIKYKDDGTFDSYSVTPKADPTQTANLGLQRVTDFAGKRYSGELSPDQVDTMRYRAAADVIGQTDPIAGLRMRREINRDEQDNTRFKNEQTDRETRLNLEKNRRSYFEELMKLDPNELAMRIGGEFSKDGSGIDAMLTFDPKGNQFIFASNVPGMPSRTMDRAELINYAMGVWEQGNGNFENGMRAVLDTVKTKRSLQEADRADASKLATANADLYWKDKNYRLDADYKLGSLANDRARLGILSRDTKNVKEFVDEKGNTVLLDIGALQKNKNGTLDVPLGLRPKTARPEVTMGNVIDYAKSLVENQTPDPDEPKKPITLEKATRVARAQLYGTGYTTAADNLTNDYLAKRPANGSGAPGAEKGADSKVPGQPQAQPQAAGLRPPRQGFAGLHQRASSELAELGPQIQPLREQVQKAVQSGNTEAIINAANRLNQVLARERELQAAIHRYTN